MDELNKMLVVLPSKDEQKRIVSFLDTETAQIDSLIDKQKDILELFKKNIIALAMSEQMHGKGELVRLPYVTHRS